MDSDLDLPLGAELICTICLCPPEDLDYVVLQSLPVTICSDCVRGPIAEKFRNAAHQINDYPARYDAGHELQLSDFPEDLLSPEDTNAYEQRAEEYACPVDNRVYCHHAFRSGDQCERFVGHATPSASIMQCRECYGITCLHCHSDLTIDDSSHDDGHCSPPARDDPLQGLIRGKDYQRCPNTSCGETVQILDGCNAMNCPSCSGSFCYICGEPAIENSDHWSTGTGSTCPKYHHPSDPNAWWIPPMRLHLEQRDGFLLEERRPGPDLLDQLLEAIGGGRHLVMANRQDQLIQERTAVDEALDELDFNDLAADDFEAEVQEQHDAPEEQGDQEDEDFWQDRNERFRLIADIEPLIDEAQGIQAQAQVTAQDATTAGFAVMGLDSLRELHIETLLDFYTSDEDGISQNFINHAERIVRVAPLILEYLRARDVELAQHVVDVVAMVTEMLVELSETDDEEEN